MSGNIEYVRGHRWVDRDGGEHWFVGAGVIAPSYVDKYVGEGGEVIYREVGEWHVYTGEEACSKSVSDESAGCRDA